MITFDNYIFLLLKYILTPTDSLNKSVEWDFISHVK